MWLINLISDYQLIIGVSLLEYLQVQMTALISLLWSLLIVKLQTFPNTVLVFLIFIKILVNSRALFQKKEWPQILFSLMPHPLINEKFICQWALHSCVLTPLHSVINREEHEKKSLLAIIYTEDIFKFFLNIFLPGLDVLPLPTTPAYNSMCWTTW